MLGSNFQKAANVVATQNIQKLLLFIRQQVIITNAAADKDLFDAR